MNDELDGILNHPNSKSVSVPAGWLQKPIGMTAIRHKVMLAFPSEIPESMRPHPVRVTVRWRIAVVEIG